MFQVSVEIQKRLSKNLVLYLCISMSLGASSCIINKICMDIMLISTCIINR